MKLVYCITLLLGALPAFSQVAVKTNMLYDAMLSPNIGLEMSFSPKWSVELCGNYNGWSVGGHTWKHWQIQPEARYWLCQRFTGHFFGIEAHAGQFNVGNIGLGLDFLGTDFGKLKNHRYQGWQGGAGITYGYAWILGRHWNIEGEIGVGYSYVKYDSFPCATCGTKLESGKTHNYFGVTKAALNLVYLF